MNATQTVREPGPALHVAAAPATDPTPTATHLAHATSLPAADVDMDAAAKDDDDDDRQASDNESVGSNSTLNPPSKKKKGQRFYCTDFPPCQLSFTRSEHLARHIRKHTGERPFQCHCSRRFSRLDNLRQHAQTVHVNEDIPGDSLAATGTRFQRQVRTDRVRPANRSRTSSLTQGTPARGHSRHLSTSSIGSVASSIVPDDYMRRSMNMSAVSGSPSTALLSLEARTPLPDTSRDSHYPHQSHFYAASHSPGAYSGPTSAAYTGTTSSPRHSGLQSPIAVAARPIAWPTGGLHRRRLSVPSVPISQQRLSAPSYPALVTPLSSNASTYSNSTSLATSPTSSTFSEAGRDQGEVDIRRRTWHPSTAPNMAGRPATSGLSYYQTPDSPRPVSAMQPAAAQAVRLPGIDSFDRMNAQSTAPARRPPSPMHIDDPPRPDSAAGVLGTAGPHKRRPSETQWDTMNQNLTRLEIASPQRPSSWRNSYEGPVIAAPIFLPADPRHSAGSSSFQLQPPLPIQPSHVPGPAAEMPFRTREDPVTPRKKKRQGLHIGGIADADQRALAQRMSPEDSSSSEGIPTPSTTSTGDYHPAIVHSNGFIETPSVGSSVDDAHKTYVHPSTQMSAYPPRTPPLQTDQEPRTPRPTLNMNRLDALAAVASSAGQHM